MRLLVAATLALVACGGTDAPSDAPPPAAPTAPGEDGPTPLPSRADLGPDAARLRLHTLGLAHHDMRAWAEARGPWTKLAAGAPDPAIAYNLAVLDFHQAAYEDAAARLDAVDAGDHRRLESRISFLRSRIAYERGDVANQLHHLMKASAADRRNVAHALAVARLGQGGGADPKVLEIHFRRALQAAPGNTRVEAEFARWAVKRPEAALKAEGEATVAALARWVEGEVPASTPGLLNALRGSRRYRLDAATVDAAGTVEPVRDLPGAAPAPPTPRTIEWSPERYDAPGSGPLQAAVVVDDMVDGVVAAMPRPGLALLRGGSISYTREAGKPAGLIARFDAANHLLAFDADADPAMELLISEAGGIHVLDRDADHAWTEIAHLPLTAPPRDVVVVDLESDHDHDLLVVDATGAVRRALNADGFGPLEPAGLPLDGLDVTRILAFDLDGDQDRDLIAHHRGGAVVLDNLRQGDYVRGGDEDEAAGMLFAVAAAPGRPRADFDLDGVEDPLPSLRHPDGVAVDMDGDGDFDVLGLGGEGEPTLYRNELAATVPRLSISLRQAQAKGPSDMRGVVVDVVHGTRTDTRYPTSPNLVLGFGARPTMVKATWPNGVSQYLLDPEPNAHHDMLLPTTLEGSCPFLYAWDGEGHRFVTDLLGVSPVGLALAPGFYASADPDEYLRLPDWVRPNDGRIDLRFTEELREVTYLDAFELIAVRHPVGTVAHSYEKWTLPFVEGFDLRVTDAPRAPARVLDGGGADVTDVVRSLDHTYLGGPTERPRYQGVLEPWSITVELPGDVAAADEPVLLLTGWLQWGNTSTNIARAQVGERPMFPVLEVPDGDGWAATDVNVGLPAGKTKPVYVSLAGALNPDDPRVRITTDFAVYWDRVAVATAVSAHTSTERIPAEAAVLQPGGFSAMHRPAPNGPHLFDYARRTPYPTRPTPDGGTRPVAWTPLQGPRTAFGSVTGLLSTVDDRSVVFGDGEEIALRFDVRGHTAEPGTTTTWFILSHGWAKDGDPNVAYSQTSEPLAWSGMTPDPYSDPGPPPEVMKDLESSLTRFVGPDQLRRRVR